MGATCSNPAEDDIKLDHESSITSEETARHRAIESFLQGEQEVEKFKARLLLLGTGESGKSTIFKQMRIIYGSEKSEEELKYYGVVVRSNIVVAIRKICNLIHALDMESELDEEIKEFGEGQMTTREAYDELCNTLLDDTRPSMVPIPPSEEHTNDWCGTTRRAGTPLLNDAVQFLKNAKSIETLWKSKIMKEVWMKRAKENINDSHKEYFDDVKRIAAMDYRPTDYDILTSRVRTTQITTEWYKFGKLHCEVIDVGGQRTERRKWIDCFEGVDAVVFVAALSEYDQNLTETRRVNRMVEALDLFETITKNSAFEESQIMLFLNKKDIFQEKVMYSNIVDVPHFSDYSGPAQDFDQGVLYFIQKFQDRLYNVELGNAFIHITHATNTVNMKFVLDALRSIIMRKNIDVFCA